MPNTEAAPPESPETTPEADVVAQIKERVAPIDQWIRTFAREQPILALATAIGIGYLAGRLIRKI